MSSEEPREPDSRTRTRLALAVRLVDGHTGQPVPTGLIHRTVSSTAPVPAKPTPPDRWEQRDERRAAPTELSVSFPKLEASPVVNPSGYVLLFAEDVPDGVTSVDVEVAGGEWYFDDRQTVELDDFDDDEDPVVRIELRPRPAYRFSKGATLVRGHVFVPDENDVPGEPPSPTKNGLVGATVKLEGFDRTTQTAQGGEYVLSLTDLSTDTIVNGDVRVDGRNPTLVVDHDDFDPITVEVRIREGHTQQYLFRYQTDGTTSYWTDVSGAPDTWQPA